jgi:hypothetical protein
MKKEFAVFTIVKDEPIFLPIWLKHYRQTFSDDDIYVIDHETKDGSTDNLNVNVIQVSNPNAFQHQWLVEQVQRVQAELLERYEVVLFAEADEIIYTDRYDNLLDALKDFRKSDQEYANVVGYECVHIMDEEGPLDLSNPIVAQRQKWIREPMYDKPLLTKVPLLYAVGFHTCNRHTNFGFGLHLFHLHRMDYDLMLKRHIWRNTEWRLAKEGGLGWQHHIHEAEAVRNLVRNGFSSNGGNCTTIPQEHQAKLAHL